MDLEGKRVIVVGLGKSGVAAAELCKSRGARVLGTDTAPKEKLSDEARTLAVELRVGGHEGVDFKAADLIVVSPGVPPLPELAAAEGGGVEVIGELELAMRFAQDPILLIGGTNGKSTTTTLVAHLLTRAGLSVFAGGNLGTPAAHAVGKRWDAIVLEVSSFQLERAPQLSPRVSVLLNVTEDHLDRYPDFEAYARAKGNAFVNQTPSDFAVVPVGDAVCEEQAGRGRGKVLRFGPNADYATSRGEGGEILERSTGARFDLTKTRLHGEHNRANAAAAIACVRAFGIDVALIQRALEHFETLPHRTELVARIRDVSFYDDSKGTNVGASVTALLGLDESRAVLIAGGRDKLGSYAPLVEALRKKGRALVLIGEAADRIEQAAEGACPIQRAKTLPEAVDSAFRLAQPGDAVLLSPACSSFDMFQSYADRGEQFQTAVRALEQGIRRSLRPPPRETR
jgi:UDP-N-acetylmuramoylalanine--D-glutamate ligase